MSIDTLISNIYFAAKMAKKSTKKIHPNEKEKYMQNTKNFLQIFY